MCAGEAFTRPSCTGRASFSAVLEVLWVSNIMNAEKTENEVVLVTIDLKVRLDICIERKALLIANTEGGK